MLLRRIDGERKAIGFGFDGSRQLPDGIVVRRLGDPGQQQNDSHKQIDPAHLTSCSFL
jgi:hypothetical protein